MNIPLQQQLYLLGQVVQVTILGLVIMDVVTIATSVITNGYDNIQAIDVYSLAECRYLH